MRDNSCITIPGSKSQSIRALLVASFARGKSKIINPLISQDTISTANALRKLNVKIDYVEKENAIYVDSSRLAEGCEEIGVPIFARGVVPRAGGKARDGRVNVAVEIGGVRVSPGDIIVGDADGVVVVRPEEAEEIMARARKKSETEAAAIKRMEETGEVLPRANMMNRQD